MKHGMAVRTNGTQIFRWIHGVRLIDIGQRKQVMHMYEAFADGAIPSFKVKAADGAVNRLLKYWFARMRPRTSTAQNGLQAIILSLARGGAPSKLSFFESSDSISAACYGEGMASACQWPVNGLSMACQVQPTQKSPAGPGLGGTAQPAPPGSATYLKPTRSSICCTLVTLAPTALMGMVSLLNGLPLVMAFKAGLSASTPLAVGHSLLPLAK